MEVSTFEENEPVVKRKRTIQYHKVKSRLNQSRQRCSNFLNKSVYCENIQKQLNESKSKDTYVSVRNVESFLAINRDLARALQETKLVVKEAERKENEIQLQCIESRKKLNSAVNALLKCTCKRDHIHDPLTQDFLTTMHATLSKCEKSCREYMDSIALNKVNVVDVEVQTQTKELSECGIQTEKVHTRGVRLQVNLDTPPPAPAPATAATAATAIMPVMKNEETQTSEVKTMTKNKLIQCSLNATGDMGKKDREATVIVLEDTRPAVKDRQKKSPKRTALQPIDFNIIDDGKKGTSLKGKKGIKGMPCAQGVEDNQSKSTNAKPRKGKNLMSQAKKKTNFQIYADEPGAKPKKKTEHSIVPSPPTLSVSKLQKEESVRLRPRQLRPDYTEAVLPKRTKRRRKVAKKMVVPPLESIISMVHDSLMRSFSMRQ